MRKNKIYNLNTQSGKIKCRTSIRTKSYNNKTLKNALINYFNDVEKGSKACEFLNSNKEKVETFSLSRTVFKKIIEMN